VGSGKDLSIKELAGKVKKITGFSGDVVWDQSKPDGTPRKLMDSSKLLKKGWIPKIELGTGIKIAYSFYLDQI